jgi:hypothetical protein
MLFDVTGTLFKGIKMRKGCRTSKTEKKCTYYSYQLQRCILGKVKATCLLCEQPKAGTKAARQAEQVRQFYNMW